jgi:predicted porin
LEITKHWKWIAAGAVGVGILAYAAHADAADLGGDCCSDLEERIAELEATTARKGTKKVTLNIYGQVSKGILFWDVEDYQDAVVSENSAAETFVGFGGEAKIDGNWKAGFVLEIGMGGYTYGTPLFGLDTNEIYTRTAALYLEGPMGKATLGHTSQATDHIAEITTANTAVAARMLSLRPLVGPELGEIADLFDGTRGDLVRYDSPVLGGFRASASWASGPDDLDVWDVALRYAGEFGGFRLAAGVGYRDGIIVPTVVALGDTVQVWSGSASIMHVTSGLFISGAAGNLSLEGSTDDLQGFHVQGGLEQRFISLGKTTLFLEWAEAKEDGASEDLTIWGAGIVQAIDPAAMDLFLNVRRIELEDDEALVGMFGARLKF